MGISVKIIDGDYEPEAFEEIAKGLEDPHMQLKLFNEIVKNQYSVRKVEEMVKLLNNGDTIQSGKRKIQARSQLSEEMTQMRRRLGGYFNAKVLVASCTPAMSTPLEPM